MEEKFFAWVTLRMDPKENILDSLLKQMQTFQPFTIKDFQVFVKEMVGVESNNFLTY